MYVGYKIRHKLGSQGKSALLELDTRQLKGKLWEIRFSQNRIAYVVVDKKNIHFLHIFKKQKGKTEKFDLDIAIQRANELGLKI
jgi:phage-related protein